VEVLWNERENFRTVWEKLDKFSTFGDSVGFLGNFGSDSEPQEGASRGFFDGPTEQLAEKAAGRGSKLSLSG
jgi:hypothetical protein